MAYKIEDFYGEKNVRIFYEKDMQKTIQTEFRIEKKKTTKGW